MSKARHSLAASTLVIATLFSAEAAQAAGVTAGTLIENTASASYTSGAATTTVQSNTVTVRVDELLDVAVATLDAAPKSVGPATAVLTFQVTNTGNGAEAFQLTADPAIAGNGFDAVVQTLAIDTNGNGVYDRGIDTDLANGGTSAAIAADGTLTVFVVVSLPADATDTETAQVRLTAEAATGTGSPGTAFGGQGEGGGDAVVGTSTAQDDALGALIASLGQVRLTKSFTIVDPFGGRQPVPGAIVTFSITANVAGSGSVSDLRVTDGIPTGTSYAAATLKLDGGALSDAADTDAGVATAAGITVDLGTVTGGSGRTVTFSTTIN